ncbi:hypothetical protein HDK77DRAFT_370449 [Phyllosticta capitalensis]|uniref:Zn(2)-C6 fungal-type domain-containing protein n=2 Tax=Phyllosticta capitalensis TaxID=121624 RepID=A0ABR1Z0D4_9PEZI
MAGHYNNLPPMPPYYNVNPGHPMMPLENFPHSAYAPALQQYQTLSSESLHQAYADLDDGTRGMLPASNSSRARRRASGNEQVKHRRTRSGCYTCRNRRVKCDETHPICERCRKGNRECVYPEPSSANKSNRSVSRAKAGSPESTSSADEESRTALPPILDEDETAAEVSTSRGSVSTASRRDRETSNSPCLTVDKSPSPSTENSSLAAIHVLPRRVPSRKSSRSNLRKSPIDRTWTDLPADVRYYLDWFRNNITCHHYALKYDSADFMRTTLLEIAAHNDHLLYAVVGFAAYHHALSKPNGRISDFLSYYSKSVQLLLLSLQRNQRRTPATLLTILQLATIEEYLGDYVNLIGHQKAAFEIITSMYTPQSIMQNETLRRVMSWYARYDLMVGILSGSETVLSREWFLSCAEFYAQQCRDRPHDVGCKFDERLAQCRLLAVDSASLFSRKAKGQVSDDAFVADCMTLDRQFDEWAEQLDPALQDPSKHLKDFGGRPPLGPDDIVDPFDPEFAYEDDLFPMNIILQDYWAIALMFKTQFCSILRQPPPPQAAEMAMNICKMFSILEHHPQSPPGMMIEMQASIGMGILNLPKDEKHTTWGRRKFAKIESGGYIYPHSFRLHMSHAFQIDVSRWWLPNDEGLPNIIRRIRAFTEERSTPPPDQTRQDLQNMKGIFDKMELGEGQSPVQTPSVEQMQMDLGKAHEVPGLGATSEEIAQMQFSEAMIYESSPEYAWNFDHQQQF